MFLLPTNAPEQLAIDWKQTCYFMCADCSKSKCKVHNHQPFFCLCHHARAEHRDQHPHECQQKDCECEGVVYMTMREMVTELRLIVITIEAIDL